MTCRAGLIRSGAPPSRDHPQLVTTVCERRRRRSSRRRDAVPARPKTHCGAGELGLHRRERRRGCSVARASGRGSTSPCGRTRRRASRRAPTRAERPIPRRRRRRICAFASAPASSSSATHSSVESQGMFGMAPRQPGEPTAVRAWARRRVEVVAAGEHRHGHRRRCDDPTAAISVAVGSGVAPCMSSRTHSSATACAVEHQVAVAKRPVLGERLRRAAARLAVEAAVGDVREVDRPVRDRVPAAAVLVCHRPRVEAARRHIDRAVALVPAHDDLAAALLWTALGPVHVARRRVAARAGARLQETAISIVIGDGQEP